MVSKSFGRAGLVLALGITPSPVGCDERPVLRADAQQRPSDSSRGYFKVEEQQRIGKASLALWTGVDPRQDWKEAADRIFVACGGTLKVDEAFMMASYHPRTTYDWTWRTQVEALLLERGRWGWDPSSALRCKAIRQALVPADPAVEGAVP